MLREAISPACCIGLILAWKLGLKVPSLCLGPYCHLQTILLSDLFGCDSPLQIGVDNWRTFFYLRRTEQPLLSVAGSHTRLRKFEFKKSAPNCHYYLQRAVTSNQITQYCPLRKYHGVFLRVEKPSEDKNSRLLLMNKKD